MCIKLLAGSHKSIVAVTSLLLIKFLGGQEAIPYTNTEAYN